ncbi:MAG: FAD-linked oxidase C-terminal domain-containing protein [Archangium sp.]|nr:FAD-linked oxidase C-terminal domain-containing protein [Archangium sp.]MDP3152600.1 FAD-linked oxidase C-terminal domain-containing protein [Archangium sp.]MDP3571020.1 FAD-linked oxidase C-terminal domain-containing protein [Archangium sp.]
MNLEALRAELQGLELADDDATRATYGHDESDQGDFLPALVVFPRDAAEVQRVVRACNTHQVPLTPVAARSGKSGGSLPIHGGISVSLERMNRIIAIRPEDLTATVQPGVILGDFQRAVEAAGLFYPPDPNSAPYCTMGGNIAENAGGPSALKYGVTGDYVLGLEWVMPTGELLKLGKQTIKGVAGYDLVGLFVGSEGTLGIATEITVKLIPLPKVVMTALIPFTDVLAAARAVNAVLLAGLLPRCLELIDDVALEAVKGKGVPFPVEAGAVIIAEIDGTTEEGVFAELNLLASITQRSGGLEAQIAVDRDQRERLWATRRMVSPALRELQKFKFSEDIVVPRSRVPEAIERFKAIGTSLGLTVATYGHAGDGNLHTNVLYRSVSDRPRVELALEALMKETVRLGGTITGEHGVGIAKRKYLSLEQSPELIALQRRIKVLLDPAVIMNPGKVFPDEP